MVFLPQVVYQHRNISHCDFIYRLIQKYQTYSAQQNQIYLIVLNILSIVQNSVFLNIKSCRAYSNQCAVTVKNQFNIILPFTSRSNKQTIGIWKMDFGYRTNQKKQMAETVDEQLRK